MWPVVHPVKRDWLSNVIDITFVIIGRSFRNFPGAIRVHYGAEMNHRTGTRAIHVCLSAAGAIISAQRANAQTFLFDATKAEMAANADWVVDADVRNIGTDSTTHQMVAGIGSESNPQ